MKRMVGNCLFLLVASHVPSTATALTVEEYNAIPLADKGGVIQQVIKGAYNQRRRQGASSETLECLRNYFTATEITVDDETVMLNLGIEHLLDEIEKATRYDQEDLHIESIGVGVMDSACPRTEVSD